MIFLTDTNETKTDILAKYQFVRDCDVLSINDPYDRKTKPSVVIADVALDVPSKIMTIKKLLDVIRSPDTEVFFILRKDTNQEIQQAITLGATSYFASSTSSDRIRVATQRFKSPTPPSSNPDKPCNLKDSIDSVGNTLEAIDRLVKNSGTIEAAVISDAARILLESGEQNSIESLLHHILDFHNETFRHSLLVSGLTASLSRRAGCSAEICQTATEGALVHDIGKSLIPLSILDKPGCLTTQERQLIEMHPVFGYDYLKRRNNLTPDILAIVRSHHELLDGSGYPDKLRENEISRAVRIVTICDIYAALIEPRSYKKAHPPMLAFAMLRGMIGKLDDGLLAVFHEMVMEHTEAKTQVA